MEPKIAQKAPFAVQVEKGQKYFWCACGLSENQPFCDGHHKVTDFKPVLFEPTESETKWLCGCKHSKNKPFCDGTHKSL
ncbi:MAG TPA: CDGSH iron-sulfur domain-containing protein [Prolixibacteraceae bacterium]|nr:CDGSH iron-sulfur domain-containing protein [Prolixibacteraceae bacterium]HPT32038.1 CDGSH iron-sulfur domain-containing protein [Prolixibacteraceae bacterium]